MATQESVDTAAAMRWSGRLCCAVAVSDFERSLAWYAQVLGFEPEGVNHEIGWAELETHIPGVTIGVGQSDDVHPAGGATLTFGVHDIDAARARLETHDARFDGPTWQIGASVRLATFYDPDGNTFMLAQRLGDRAVPV
jgi:predicted enzyme related to lactoylglutathione lyase